MKAKEVLKARDTYMKSFIYVLMTGACTFSAVSIDNKHNITTKATEYEKFYEHIYEKITPDDKVWSSLNITISSLIEMYNP